MVKGAVTLSNADLQMVAGGTAARLLGIANRVGSLEAGKDADLALFDGDPFEYTSHVVKVIINGRVVSEEVR